MNTPTLKGYIQEAIKFERMIKENLEKRINDNVTDTFIKDYEDLMTTEGKILAFSEILIILQRESKKEGVS